ncbi:CMRF35-like molecule 1 isoform X3 [Callorhinus ursinus]|uniref:CMRF35-like molecule 1 isoform X3 n=2 Tax=Callorhinus ursinus TaxID=34884 RepID=UPI003CD03453
MPVMSPGPEVRAGMEALRYAWALHHTPWLPNTLPPPCGKWPKEEAQEWGKQKVGRRWSWVRVDWLHQEGLVRRENEPVAALPPPLPACRWKTYSKWWCRGAEWSYCRILVQTNGSEQKKKGDRVSIKDNHKSRTFTVTMEELRWNDADTYWCGIERSGTDLGVKVKVTIDPVSTTTTTTTSTTMSTTPAETKGPRTVTSHHSNGSANFMKLSILIPLMLAVLLLLLVTASLLALRKMKQQKRAAGISPEQVLQPPEGDLCYANLALEPTSTSHNSSQKKACTKSSSSALGDQQEVEYVTMAPFWKEDISYAALSWEPLNQESTYYNMNYHVAQVPSRSHEEPMEYSSIRRS